jgi:outer membrane protein assembly factor BamB
VTSPTRRENTQAIIQVVGQPDEQYYDEVPNHRMLSLIALLGVTCLSIAQAPWPLERQDRWGSGHAIVGPDPATLTTPWISNRLAFGFPVSHGASLGENGIGYFGDWVDNKLFKINYNTGAILGSFQAGNFVSSVPALAGPSTALFSTETGKIYSIDTNIMDFNWFYDVVYTGGSPNLGPNGDTVYGTSGGTVFRRGAFTGTQIWSHPGLFGVNGTVVFTRDDTKVIVTNGTWVTALNWVDGTTAWSINYGSTMRRAAVAPNGTIVVGSDSGTVYGLNPANGAVLWTWVTLDKVTGAAAFSPDGTIAYVPSYDWRVYALRVADGTRAWSFTTSHWLEHAPTVGFDGRIYVHNKVGVLYCISPAGALIWSVQLNGESRGPMTIGPDGTLYVGYTGNQAGLAMIRQQGISLPPETFMLDRGILISGALTQVILSDDDYIQARNGFVLNASEPPVRMVFTTHSPYNPVKQIKVTLEAAVTTPSITRYVELWNSNINAWEVVDSAAASVTDTTATITVNDASRFADGSGLIKARVGFKPTGPLLAGIWSARVDYVHFDLVPHFVP